MHATELQALRRLLGYSIDEAARHIPADGERPRGVEPRTWSRWESGQRPIPDTVAARVLQLVAWRGQALQTIREALLQAPQPPSPADPVRLVWYSEADDWPDAPALWRPAQTVAAQLLAEHQPGAIELVPFDARAFRAWRAGAGQPDGPAAHAAWAALQDRTTAASATSSTIPE